MCTKSKPKITGPATNAHAEDGSRRIHWPSYWGLCVGHWLSLAYGPMDLLADPLDPWIQPSLGLCLLFLGKLAVELLWSPPLSITHTSVFSVVLIFFVWLELMISSFPPIGSSTVGDFFGWSCWYHRTIGPMKGVKMPIESKGIYCLFVILFSLAIQHQSPTAHQGCSSFYWRECVCGGSEGRENSCLILQIRDVDL